MCVCVCVYIYIYIYAAAKSLQSCPTLCNPIDDSPWGFPVPGILQARTLEWVAISFSNAWKWKVKGKSLRRVRLFATPWPAAYQAPLPWDSPGKSTGVGCHCLLQYTHTHTHTHTHIYIYICIYQHTYYDTKCQCLLNVSIYCWNISTSAAVVARAALEIGIIYFWTNVQPVTM